MGNNLQFPTLSSIPDLSDPSAFDGWRKRWLVNGGASREQLVALLETQGDTLARLRASSLLTTTDSTRAQQLASTALVGDDPIHYLMGKTQLTIIAALAAWKAENPRFAVEPAAEVLEGILTEIRGMQRKSLLVLELMVRIHGILADSYTLLQDFSRAKRHAAEVTVLAEPIGLHSFSASATYQLANIAYYQGDVLGAEGLFRQAAENPNSSLIVSERAHGSRALALSDLGDEDGVEQVLNAIHLELDAPEYWQAESLRFLTLRHPWAHDSQVYIKHTPHTSSALVMCFRHIVEADALSPDQTTEIRSCFSKAYAALHPLMQSSLGWRQLDQRVTAAYIAHRLGEYSIAWQRLPSLQDIQKLPLAARLRGLFVGIEVLERQLPLTAVDLWAFATAAVQEMCNLEGRIASQQAAKFLLLNPVALAFLSRVPSCPDVFVNAGYLVTINVNARPLSVLNQQGLPPIQAVRYILEVFACKTDLFGRLGGGQFEALKRSLYRPYFHRECWHRPVPAIQIAYAMLCCAESVGNTMLKSQLLRSVQDLKRCFGFIPRLQKVDRMPDLEQIEQTMDLLLAGGISSVSAAKLLFGQEARV